MSDWRKRARKLTETLVPAYDRAQRSLEKLVRLGVTTRNDSGRYRHGDGPWIPCYGENYSISSRGDSVYDLVIATRDKLPEALALLAEAEEENRSLRAQLAGRR